MDRSALAGIMIGVAVNVAAAVVPQNWLGTRSRIIIGGVASLGIVWGAATLMLTGAGDMAWSFWQTVLTGAVICGVVGGAVTGLAWKQAHTERGGTDDAGSRATSLPTTSPKKPAKVTVYYGPDHSIPLDGATVSADINKDGDVSLPYMYVSNDGRQRADEVTTRFVFSEPVSGALKEQEGYPGGCESAGGIPPGGGHPIGGPRCIVRFEGSPKTVGVTAKTDYLFSPSVITRFTLILKPTPGDR